jgi:hypothetical protein
MPEHRQPTPVGVPLLRLAAFSVIVTVVSLTVYQCLWVYHGESASVGPKLCLAEQLDAFPHEHWLHDTALLSAACLRAMLALDPAFDLAVLAPVDAMDEFASRLVRNCGFTRRAPVAPGWTWELAAKGKLFKFTRFELTTDAEQMYHRVPNTRAEVLETKSVLPTTPCSVGRATFKCPRDEGALLASIFGKKWQSEPLMSLL